MDAAIGELVTKLKAQGLYDSTLIVITAKHGQSPIDPNRYVSQLINGSSPVTLLSNAGYIPNSESNNPSGIGPTEDDVSLIWLKNSADNDASVKLLEENAYETGIGLGQIYYGPSLTLNYNDPMVDPRTPDIIVAPNVGVTYSGSKKKLEEHGGFSHDDTNVMLLVAFPGIEPRTMKIRGKHCPGCADHSQVDGPRFRSAACGAQRRNLRTPCTNGEVAIHDCFS